MEEMKELDMDNEMTFEFNISEEMDEQTLKEELLRLKHENIYLTKTQNMRTEKLKDELVDLRRKNTDLQQKLEAALSAHLSNEYLPLLVDAKDKITYVNRMQQHVSEETQDTHVLKEELLIVKEQMAHVEKLQNIRIDEMAEEILTLRRENTDLQERLAAATESVNLSVENLPPFDESKDNFDAYIWRFEMYAKLRKWPRSVWAMQCNDPRL